MKRSIYFTLVTLIVFLSGSLIAIAGNTQNNLNLARFAFISDVSSSYNDYFSADKAIDGLRIRNLELNGWMSDCEMEAWARLDWDSSFYVESIKIYDRPSENDAIVHAVLELSDGSVIEINDMPDAPDGKTVNFNPPVSIDWLIINVNADASNESALAVGIDEIEVFSSGINIAQYAVPTVSSVYPDAENKFSAANLISHTFTYIPEATPTPCEWASYNERTPYIVLSWEKPVTMDTVYLYDRNSAQANVISGRIIFDDDTFIDFGVLPISGQEPLIISFESIQVTSMKIEITESIGSNVGFAEIEVYNFNGDDTGNPQSGSCGILCSKIMLILSIFCITFLLKNTLTVNKNRV